MSQPANRTHPGPDPGPAAPRAACPGPAHPGQAYPVHGERPTPPPDLPAQVAAALAEDLGARDVTAELVPEGQQVHGQVITREAAVLCGVPWVQETFRRLDPRVRLDWQAADGDRIEPGERLLRVSGPARPILTGERTALNFLQLLSATATAARRYVDAVAGTGCTILDTRKTLPGLRTAQKYAVRCGGARNHRLGLYDMVLIKENHIAAAGSITAAISQARSAAPGMPVECEVESLAQLEQALAAGPDIILLDNFAPRELAAAVARNRAAGSPVKLEASGGVSLEGVRALAETGVDFISVGGLTKHVQAVDLSMRLEF
ncbi:MAG TPA: carboxylating nicotinate-nucleotide diphosphorylase [Steroidobacteraceae bacterium]|nr:carboxylating nicotinate-nucleotide diphosphorylase [Steroidobacteraceae bacterium]